MIRSLLRGISLFASVGLAVLLAGPAAHGGDLIPPKVLTMTPGGVNIADCSYNYSQTDLAIGSLSLERFWLGMALHDPDTPQFGVHMTSNFDIYVNPQLVPSQRVGNITYSQYYETTVHIGSGSSGSYHESMYAYSIVADNDEAAQGRLFRQNSGGVTDPYIYIDQSGTKYIFNPAISAGGASSQYSQRVSSIQYSSGRILSFGYNSSNQLKYVTDSNGYAIVFDHAPSGYIADACGLNLSQTTVSVNSTCSGAAVATSYAYSGTTSPASLTSATDVMGQTTTYANTPSGYCITPAGYSVCKYLTLFFTVDPAVVFKQTFGDGSVWQFGCGSTDGTIDDNAYFPTDGDNTSTVTDPAGKVWTYQFTKTSPYAFTDPNGNVTNYVYSGSASYFNTNTQANLSFNYGPFLNKAVLPEGGQYIGEYGTYFVQIVSRTLKAKPGSGLADQVETFNYNSCSSSASPSLYCTQPISHIDPKGNETDYTYDPTHGGVLTETDPADASGVRPQTRYSYTLLYPQVWNGSGLANGTPQYKLTRTSTCQTATVANPASCVGTAAETVTTYAYGDAHLDLTAKTVAAGNANPLQPYSATNVWATTSYSYDAYGNPTVVDGPRTDVDDRNYTTYDIAHRKIYEISADPDGPGTGNPRVVVKHNYDIDGREILTQTGTGNATDGSDFVPISFKRMTYDVMDRVVKTEAGYY